MKAIGNVPKLWRLLKANWLDKTKTGSNFLTREYMAK